MATWHWKVNVSGTATQVTRRQLPAHTKGTASKRQPLWNQVVGEAGIEPTTPGLEGRCFDPFGPVVD